MFAAHFQKDIITTISAMEQLFIQDYLVKQGFCLEDLETLPAEIANKVLNEACMFASTKLIEIQTRIQYLTHSVSKNGEMIRIEGV